MHMYICVYVTAQLEYYYYYYYYYYYLSYFFKISSEIA